MSNHHLLLVTPAVKELAIHPSIVDIIARVQEEPVDEKQSRNISIYSCWEISCAKAKEIEGLFGTSDAAVSQAILRLVLKREKDRVITRLETKLKSVRS